MSRLRLNSKWIISGMHTKKYFRPPHKLRQSADSLPPKQPAGDPPVILRPEPDPIEPGPIKSDAIGYSSIDRSTTHRVTDPAIRSKAREIFAGNFNSLSHGAELKHVGTTQVDRIFPLGNKGVLIFGWHFSRIAPQSITLCSPEGRSVQIQDHLFFLPRSDVNAYLADNYPDVDGELGFCCLAALPTKPSDPRLMGIDYGEHGIVWLRLPEVRPLRDHLSQVRDMLDLILTPENLRHRLFTLFDTHLGPAIEALRDMFPRRTLPVTTRQYGSAPVRPLVSVIVPLYGNPDFLRHQLAQFADDADFQNADLIYVVDDPKILLNVLDLAGQLHDVFGVPFRLVMYEANLGYAAANNIGVGQARCDELLLLNSDVIPKASGWLSLLRQALYDLPGTGTVAPLLLFHDDAVQHAGMTSEQDSRYANFLLNQHPGKGFFWNGGDNPVEQIMLTAACLLLRKKDYLQHGGLDEGYLIGDFEDSDLCLGLRKTGKRHWLIPKIRLWHLERQSQSLRITTGTRLLFTLFNAWRQQQKIRQGHLADPKIERGKP